SGANSSGKRRSTKRFSCAWYARSSRAACSRASLIRRLSDRTGSDMIHGLLDRGTQVGRDRAIARARHATGVEEHRAESRPPGADDIHEGGITEVDGLLRGGA